MDVVKSFIKKENAKEAASDNEEEEEESSDSVDVDDEEEASDNDEGEDGPGPFSSNAEHQDKKRGPKRAACDNGEGVTAKRGRPPKKKPD